MLPVENSVNRQQNVAKIGIDCSNDLYEIHQRKVLWGVAPTGDIHLGYASHLFLLKQMQTLGTEVVLLLANFHGYLDSTKTEWGQTTARTLNYRNTLARAGFTEVLETNQFYFDAKYITSLFELSAHLLVEEALLAGQTTLSANTSASRVADLMYVTTQVLDVKFLGATAVLCGKDEADIYRFALPLLSKHYGMDVHPIYLPMCPGILRPEMHASDTPDNKILLTDTSKEVAKKVARHIQNLPDLTATGSLPAYCAQTLFPLAGLLELGDALSNAIANSDRSLASEMCAVGISEALARLMVANA